MAVQQIVFWRHGQTDLNLQGRIQGSSDIPLNEKGRSQAKAIAPELAKLNPNKIFVSDLGRAQETAQFLVDLIGIEPFVTPQLRERCYGVWEGQTSDEIKAQWPDEWLQWRTGNEPEGVGVETREHCGIRVRDFVENAVNNADDGETLVFVAHGGSIVNGIMSLLGMNPSEWAGIQGLDNCRWAVLKPRKGSNPQWRLTTYNVVNVASDELENVWR
ncbi:histidine phosphatase family protein [Arcanobacterium ihumii]|uniref:histidine phosphatase family protein n=1 Tax=Arcanobacterium ihumii TaxID=2138162 RepID=UPI000F548441|nr:histidine phosphatase family protein [Arcanobacterium ihumii]